MPSSSDNVIAITTVLVIAVIGLLANGTAVYIVCVIRSLHNPFGTLSAGFAICHCTMLLVVTLWMTPAIAIGGAWNKSLIGVMAGQISNSMYYAAITISLIIAVNRFCAISFPTTYSCMFTQRVAFLSLAIIWMTSLLMCSIYYIDGCAYKFDTNSFLWHFGNSLCGEFLSFYVDFLFGLIVVIAAMLVDTVTLFKLWSYAKLMKKATNGVSFQRRRKELIFFMQLTKKATNGVSFQRRRKELIFFMQSCLYTSIFVVGIILFHVVSKSVSSTLGLFACVTVGWITAHSLCGVVFVGFNWKLLYKRNYLNGITVAAKALTMKNSTPSSQRRYNNA
ncbi:Serpentine receptor class X 45 [Toxocara canis]|uniref:Serpentine receptor class X 45 n=1 Tax=Toxocara canis TaxID=6265 RepID=A0A0B2UXU9_TOXCA|nr:Serpentine receptor class X 45 [Toxocara canis]